MKIENVIFDLDGTLIDSAEDVVDCLQKAYQAVLPRNKYLIPKTIIGPPLNQMIMAISPDINEAQKVEIIRNFRQFYDSSNYPNTIPFPKVKETLKKLQELHVNLFIATNKPTLATARILNNLQMMFFKEILCIDSVKGKTMTKIEMICYVIEKYCPKIKAIVMVGDAESDISAAMANKIPSVLFISSGTNDNGLGKSRPNYIIHGFDELYPLILNFTNNTPYRYVQ